MMNNLPSSSTSQLRNCLAFLILLLQIRYSTQFTHALSGFEPSSSSVINSNNDDTRVQVPMNTPARQSLPPYLRLAPITGKGLGVITTEFIPAQKVVGDYKGEVLTAEEKDRRYLKSFEHLQTAVDEAWIKSRVDRQQTITGSYLYGVPTPFGPSIYVDAEDEYCSLWTRFINHASSPAANVNPKSIHESYDGNPRVWFVSNRNIEAGEEICFDYGEDYWLPGDEVY